MIVRGYQAPDGFRWFAEFPQLKVLGGEENNWSVGRTNGEYERKEVHDYAAREYRWPSPMVQSADLRNRNDLALTWRFNFAKRRCVAIQGQVRTHLVIVIEIHDQHAFEMDLVQHNHVVQTLSNRQWRKHHGERDEINYSQEQSVARSLRGR